MNCVSEPESRGQRLSQEEVFKKEEDLCCQGRGRLEREVGGSRAMSRLVWKFVRQLFRTKGNGALQREAGRQAVRHAVEVEQIGSRRQQGENQWYF